MRKLNNVWKILIITHFVPNKYHFLIAIESVTQNFKFIGSNCFPFSIYEI